MSLIKGAPLTAPASLSAARRAAPLLPPAPSGPRPPRGRAAAHPSAALSGPAAGGAASCAGPGGGGQPSGRAMHSLAQEIRNFSKANLRKQRTRVTTLTGRRIIETWRGACLQVEEEAEAVPGGGFVRDLSCDLQVGAARPWLLLGSQDAAHDLETLRKHKVTHILNVAYGVQNAFLNDFIYKTISILDLPETDITSYFPECFEFIEKAKIQDGVVLVHCNAGVSRAAAIVIGFLMNSERLSFASAFSLVKSVRPSICPNPGFMEQLHKYQEQNIKANGSINDHD